MGMFTGTQFIVVVLVVAVIAAVAGRAYALGHLPLKPASLPAPPKRFGLDEVIGAAKRVASREAAISIMSVLVDLGYTFSVVDDLVGLAHSISSVNQDRGAVIGEYEKQISQLRADSLALRQEIQDDEARLADAKAKATLFIGPIPDDKVTA